MGYIVIIIIIIAIIGFFKTPTGKGIIGETIIKIVLGKNRPHKYFYVINDLTFHDGVKSVQIDHIVINLRGVHVIETKNYAGRIYGGEYHHEWTQVLAYGKVKNKFYSPIKQNEGHINSLKKVMGSSYPVNSYIVFMNRASLYIRSSKIPVIHPWSLKRAIKKSSSNTDYLSENQVISLYQSLLELKRTNTITKKQHIHAINERKQARDMYKK